MAFLSQRRRRPEIMDQPGLEPRRHGEALHGLARLNFFSRSAGILWPPLADLARRLAPRPVRVLDLATASGDVPVRLGKRARRHGLDLRRGLGGLVLAHVACRLLTRSDVVHVDGPRSVEAAFTIAEARALAERAGLTGAVVGRRWPFRFLLTWEKA